MNLITVYYDVRVLLIRIVLDVFRQKTENPTSSLTIQAKHQVFL